MTIERNVFGRVTPLNPPDESNADDIGFDIAGLMQMVRVRYRLIIGTALTIFAFTTVVVFQMAPLYDASAYVMLEQKKNRSIDTGTVLLDLSTDTASIENQLQILQSRTL